VRVITGEARSCSTNFLLAGLPDCAMDLDAAPDVVNRLTPDASSGCLVHANHFVDAPALGIQEPPTRAARSRAPATTGFKTC
jgi:isopenicillin-N N-acyltransferase-like protein